MAAKKRSVRKAVGRPKAKKTVATARTKATGSRRTAASTPARKPAKAPAGKPSKRTAAASRKPVAKPAKAAPARQKTPRSAVPATVRHVRRAELRPVTSSVGLIHGIPPYQSKSGEGYMNDRQLEHFRHILLAWKRELMEEVDRTVHHMQDEASNFPDPNDRATQESEFGLELRTRDRERKLLKKIDSALERIEEGSYGYCEETGEEIGLRRLEARPVATLSVEAQERRELAERQFRDREDGY
ncbi:MAG: RNA polymerase-binding protein DksA [Gammaproteobacteria bacterium]|nr:MAG: RNA polymerase-binding protein DksA [Gammaproteobacteria bacterium]